MTPQADTAQPSGKPTRETVLLWANIVLVVLVATAVAYVVYAGAMRPAPPRTFFEREIQATKQLIADNPESAEAWRDYLGVVIASGDYSTAETEIKRAMKATGDDPRIMVAEARLLAAQGKREEAITQAVKAQKAEEKKLLDYARNLYKERGIAVQAQDADQTTRIDALVLQAALHAEGEQWDAALKAYSDALESNPNLLDVLTSRGYVYLELGEPEKAKDDFRSALRFDAANEAAQRGMRMADEVNQ